MKGHRSRSMAVEVFHSQKIWQWDHKALNCQGLLHCRESEFHTWDMLPLLEEDSHRKNYNSYSNLLKFTLGD